MARSASLRADLFSFGHDGTRAGSTPSDYTQRIADSARYAPSLLLAHLYTRYMGDLSGGQILKRSVVKGLALDDAAGISFYEFPELQDIEETKIELRERLDALSLDDASKRQIAAEAKLSFRLNRSLSDDVWRRHKGPRRICANRGACNVGDAQ